MHKPRSPTNILKKIIALNGIISFLQKIKSCGGVSFADDAREMRRADSSQAGEKHSFIAQ